MRRLPLYAERAIGELQASRAMTSVEFERQFRADHAVSCKSGCASCCFYPVLISIGEGVLLYRFLASKGRLTSSARRKLHEHGERTTFLDPAVWMRTAIPCPLLNERKQCQGYEARPLACRLTYSAGDPEQCDPQAFNPDDMPSIRDISALIQKFETKLLQAHGVSTVRMPVSRAILLAERVINGELEINQIELALFEEHMKP